MHPNEYGRLMGIASMDLSEEEDEFGDGEPTDTQDLDEEVANDLINSEPFAIGPVQFT